MSSKHSGSKTSSKRRRCNVKGADKSGDFVVTSAPSVAVAMAEGNISSLQPKVSVSLPDDIWHKIKALLACPACMKSNDLNVSKCGFMWHTECWNGCRAKHRHLTSTGGNDAVTSDVQLLHKDLQAWQLKNRSFLPTATKTDRIQGAAAARDEGKSFQESVKVEARVGKDQDLIMEWRYFKIEYAKWHPELDPLEVEEAFDEFHATQNGKWNVENGPKRVSWKNPIYLDETRRATKSEEVSSRQRHARPKEFLHARLRLRKILGDGDSDNDDSEDDMDDVHHPLQATPGMSDHHLYFCFIAKTTHTQTNQNKILFFFFCAPFVK